MSRRSAGRSAGHPPSGAERNRALRAAAIFSQAEQTFANDEKARLWLRRPTSALGGRRPIDLLDHEAGCRQVEQLLHGIEHGIVA